MLFENIERELADGAIALANQLESYPIVDDCWEIAAKRQLKLSYKLLRNFNEGRRQKFNCIVRGLNPSLRIKK